MTWIRVESDEAENPVYSRLGTVLGLSADLCFAKVVRVWGKVSRHAPDGDVSMVPDDKIEEWAQWSGMPGAFARAFIAEFVTDGWITTWEEQQGKLVARAKAERDRKSAERARTNHGRSKDKARTREP